MSLASTAPAPALPTTPIRRRTVPRLRRRKRRAFFILVGVLCCSALAGFWLRNRDATTYDALDTEIVQYGDLPREIEVRGDLAPCETTEIICHVKALGSSPFASTIRWVIPQGETVQRGQLLVQLDDSQYQEELAARRVPLEVARSDWLQAVENHKIVVSQSEGDILTAKAALQIAELDLKKYTEGDYQQTRKDILGRMHLAEADLTMAQEHQAYMERMGRRGFMSENQVRADRLRAEKSRLTLDQIREELRLLDQYGHRRTLTELEGKLAEARRAVSLAKEQARAKIAQAESDRLSKQRVYQQLLNRYHEIEAEVAKCRITAPHDGMVLYHLSEQARTGFGNQAVVAEGEQVREGQKLLRVAQLKRMIVRTWVHEALIGHVHGESDVASRSHMQQALIRVDAVPDHVYHGHVQVVGAVPWMVNGRMDGTLAFQTIVAIDEPAEQLRPDMTARVTILMEDDAPKNVLTIPVDAILPGIGNHRRCYVLTEEGPQEREVVVGMYNDEMAQIVSGLEEGEEVVLNAEGTHPSGGVRKHRRAHRR